MLRCPVIAMLLCERQTENLSPLWVINCFAIRADWIQWVLETSASLTADKLNSLSVLNPFFSSTQIQFLSSQSHGIADAERISIASRPHGICSTNKILVPIILFTLRFIKLSSFFLFNSISSPFAGNIEHSRHVLSHINAINTIHPIPANGISDLNR